MSDSFAPHNPQEFPSDVPKAPGELTPLSTPELSAEPNHSLTKKPFARKRMQMLMGLLFFILTAVGGVSAYMLSQSSQDLRQQAAGETYLKCKFSATCPKDQKCINNTCTPFRDSCKTHKDCIFNNSINCGTDGKCVDRGDGSTNVFCSTEGKCVSDIKQARCLTAGGSPFGDMKCCDGLTTQNVSDGGFQSCDRPFQGNCGVTCQPKDKGKECFAYGGGDGSKDGGCCKGFSLQYAPDIDASKCGGFMEPVCPEQVCLPKPRGAR